MLDTIEQARAGDFAEPQPARPPASLSAATSSSSSPEVPCKQSPAGPSSSLQLMRPSQATARAKPGSASLGSLSLTNGSSSIPSWMGAPAAPGIASTVGSAYSQVGGNTLSSSSIATAGVLSATGIYPLWKSWALGTGRNGVTSAQFWRAYQAAWAGLCGIEGNFVFLDP